MQMQRCELEMSTRARGICSNDDVYEDMTLWSYDDGEVSFLVKLKPDKQCQTLKTKIRDGGQDVHVASKRSKPNHMQSKLDDCSTLTKDHVYTGSAGISHSNINAGSCQTEAVIPSSSTKTLHIGEGTGATHCLSGPQGTLGQNVSQDQKGRLGQNVSRDQKGRLGQNVSQDLKGRLG